MTKKIVLTPQQKKALEDFWFEWGNSGHRATLRNHKFIQGFLERGEDLRNFYLPDRELIALVDVILSQPSEIPSE